MKTIFPLVEWLERTAERLLGALLRGLVAVLTRLTRRGAHRPWRREQERRGGGRPRSS